MPGYRPPSSEPRGKWAKRIHEHRRALGMSQQRAFEVLGERLGFSPKSRAAYVALDMGVRQPTEAEAAVLAEWLGGYPADEPVGAAIPDDTVGMAALVTALSDLVEELRASRRERDATEVRLRAVEAELESLRASPKAGGSPTRSSRRAKAG